MIDGKLKKSGRGAAWLARLLGVQEVPGSNPGGPTKTLQTLTDFGRPRNCVLESNRSPKVDAITHAVVADRTADAQKSA